MIVVTTRRVIADYLPHVGRVVYAEVDETYCDSCLATNDGKVLIEKHTDWCVTQLGPNHPQWTYFHPLETVECIEKDATWGEAYEAQTGQRISLENAHNLRRVEEEFGPSTFDPFDYVRIA